MLRLKDYNIMTRLLALPVVFPPLPRQVTRYVDLYTFGNNTGEYIVAA
jgi:hypothetical protein